MTRDADVAVIGNGVVGLAVAHALLGRGHAVDIFGPRVACAPGQASGAAGAMLSMFSEVDATQSDHRVELEVTQRLRAFARYPAWLADVASASGEEPVSLVAGTWVIAGDNDRDSIDAIARSAAGAGHIAELHSRPNLDGLRPDKPPSAGLWLPTEPSVDVTQLLTSLEKAVARHRNARWYEPAVALGLAGRTPFVECPDGTKRRCARVVLAAGVGIPALVGRHAAELRIPPILAGQGTSMVLDTDIRINHTIRTPNTAFACGTHLVPRGPSAVYVGATNRLTLTPKAESRPTLDEIGTLITQATQLVDHRLAAAELRRAQVGFRPYTLDHLPLIGPTADPRVLLATATYRCGVLLAPLIAELITDVVRDQSTMDTHPYRACRPMPTPQLPDLLTPELLDGAVDHLLGPRGEIGASGRRRIAALLAAAIRVGSEVDGVRSALREAMTRLFAAAPVAEIVPSLLTLTERLEVTPCPSATIPPPRSFTQSVVPSATNATSAN